MRRGWFQIEGQLGDRTLEEQVAALRPAIAECHGKTIVDLGSAEGLISREFARAGAKMVTGIESLPGHVAVANRECAGLKNIEFINADLNVAYQQYVFNVDIVLALGIAHKLPDPADCILFAARSASELVLIRSGRGADKNGIITSKFATQHGDQFCRRCCDSHSIMKAHKFVLEKIVDGPPPHSEPVEYWRKQK